MHRAQHRPRDAGRFRRRTDAEFEEFFWSLVARGGEQDCWEWQGLRHYKGYGEIAVARRRHEKAHRVAWTLTHGPIPEGLCVLHRCDNPPCCNSAHLRLGTNLENVEDAVTKGRRAIGERAGRAKLTETDVLAIRAAHSRGEAFTATLATKYGISSRHVSAIVRHESWRHIH